MIKHLKAVYKHNSCVKIGCRTVGKVVCGGEIHFSIIIKKHVSDISVMDVFLLKNTTPH